MMTQQRRTINIIVRTKQFHFDMHRQCRIALGGVAHYSVILPSIVGLVVKASASRAEDPGFESRLRRDFSGVEHTSDLKLGTPVATLPGAWRYRVSARTGWPCVSILWLGEMEGWICNFDLNVTARKIVSWLALV